MKIKIIKKGISRFLVLILFFLGFALNLSAQKLNLNLKDVTIKSALKEVTKQTGYNFLYSDALKGLDKKISIDYSSQNTQIDALLSKLFNGTDIIYTIKAKQIALHNKEIKSGSKTMQVKGVVKDDSQSPLPGVSIVNKTTNKFATSSIDGNYLIDATEGDVLEFSSIGLANYQAIVGKNAILNISMKPDVIALEDVVVTGYQTISKERAAGSYAVVTTEKIEKKLQTNILERLEGMVAGMSMYRGVPVIRGTATLKAETAPLYVVDGVPFEGDIAAINPNDITNVSVLKDATAASIYGARSTNGVIVITTRMGTTGKINVNYNGTLNITPLADRDYANLMSSSEFIDYQMYMFDKGVSANTKPNNRYSMNEVYRLLFAKRDGNITEAAFNSRITELRGLDRYNQVKEELMNKTTITHQHNISFNGGSDFYKYSFSLNYQGTSPYDKGKYSDRLGFNVRNNFNLAKWIQVDLGIMGSDAGYEYDNGISGVGILDKGDASYYMLRDASGTPVRWENGKSEGEIDRLKSVGLFNEAYCPVNELNKTVSSSKRQYINVNLGARVKILESLNAEIRYQTERTNGYNKTYYTKDAWYVKNMINNAAQLNGDGSIKYNIPVGGQVKEENRNDKSYTLRAQINYSQKFSEKHDVKVLVGAERRKVTSESNGHYRFGYDDYNLSFKNINETELNAGIRNSQSVTGRYSHYVKQPANTSIDDRYISFYGNASYMFNNKLGVNASIRMDQSNLFGTDPKYQYRPLWSAGANYLIFGEGEVKWLNKLSARATYGINGNVYKKSGPYIISEVSRWANWETNETVGEIVSPPNSALRWEKTKTINLGVDFAMFSHRLNGSVDFYNKKTSDLIGNRSADPTMGWEDLLVNYATMRNTGVEVVLESRNIVKKDFSWNTNLLFSYNSNKISNLENAKTSAFDHISGLQTREGKPFNSLYSVRYAGLNSKGMPLVYKANGTIVDGTDKLTPEDVVYSGTYNPPYSASMTNSFTYKGIELSFMFVYYGGHVMRDIASAYYPNFTNPHESVTKNIDRIHGTFWKEKGDELKPDMAPAYTPGAQMTQTYLWRGADKHIQAADYIKLRDVSISYSLPKALVSKAKLQGVRVTFQAQNVWKWSANKNNLDPEVWTSSQLEYTSRGASIPPSFIIGLNLNF